jgi:hypothetical protein
MQVQKTGGKLSSLVVVDNGASMELRTFGSCLKPRSSISIRPGTMQHFIFPRRG